MQIGVLFDMDGVLIDSNPYHKQALDVFLSKYGFAISEEERKRRLYGRANKDWINDLWGDALTEMELYTLGSEKEATWRSLYESEIKPLSGVTEFIEALLENEVPFAMSTSAPPENVIFSLQKTHLSSLFTTILHQDHVKKGKPDPEIYLQAAKALRIPPSECIVFEDSLAEGYRQVSSPGAK